LLGFKPSSSDLRDKYFDEKRLVDSDGADAMNKLGPLDDEDPMSD